MWGEEENVVMKSADTPTGSVRVGVVSIPVMPTTQKRVRKNFLEKNIPIRALRIGACRAKGWVLWGAKLY